MTTNLVSFTCLKIMSHIRILVFSDGLLRNPEESRTGIRIVGNSASCMDTISFILEIRNGWTNSAASVEPNEANHDLLPVFRTLSKTAVYIDLYDLKSKKKKTQTNSRRRTSSGFTLLDLN